MPAAQVGRPSDIWSLGCIMYQMVYGRTPFAELPFLQKMHAICDHQYQVGAGAGVGVAGWVWWVVWVGRGV